MIHFISLYTQNFEIPVQYQVYGGNVSIEPADLLEFPPSIPGVMQTKMISAKSNINKVMYIRSVSTSDPKRISAKIVSNSLSPNTDKNIIRVSTVSHDKTNSFFRLNSMIQENLNWQRMNLQRFDDKHYEQNLTHYDVLAWQIEENELKAMELASQKDTSLHVTIETNLIQNISIPVKSIIARPKLLDVDEYVFERLEVGTSKRGTVTIFNPSPLPMEISFYIAPPNFLENVINELFSESKLSTWRVL